jgi:hypothetical protein
MAKLRGRKFTLLDRQTGEEAQRSWTEAWRGETEAGREQGQAPEGEPTEDRSGESGRQSAAQSAEEEVT